MDFVGRIARKVTVLHEGTRARRRAAWTPCQHDPRVIEVYLGR